METVKIKASKLEESQRSELKRKLKQHPGISKVSIDSENITVFYDKNELTEEKILKAIEKQTGCWGKIIDESNGIHDTKALNQKLFFPPSLGVFSIIVNIVLMVIVFRLIPNASVNSDKIQTNPQVLAGQTTAANIKQEFTISEQDHVRGNKNAPITLVEFSDFECPFCEKIEPTFQKILKDYDNKVKLVYKHFPLSFHPNGQKAAEASECASEQGKFWEYHDKLFQEQANGFSIDNFKTWAKELNLKKDQFNKCLDSEKYAEKVKSDTTEGEQKGVDGTPATFVNGQLVSGAVPYEEFKKIIDKIK